MPYKDPKERYRRRKARMEADPEYKKEVYAMAAEWRRKNKDKMKVNRDRHKNKDIEKFRRERQEWRKKRRKDWPWMRTYEGIYTRIAAGKRGKKKYLLYANVKMLLSMSEIKELWFRDKAYELKSPSIDRIDPDGDYVFDNCRYIEIIDNVKRARKRGSVQKTQQTVQNV